MASIYEEIGGGDSVAAAVDDFYARVLADPALEGYFAQTDISRLKSHQRQFIAAAIGGPEPYEGIGMDQAHAGRGITDEHFDKVVGHLVETLSGLGVPTPTIEAIGGKLEPLRADIVQA